MSQSSAVEAATAEPGNRIAIAGIGVALLVVAIKMVAYWTTGSLALYSDALEGFVNVATAIAAAFALHMARRPADTRHQYGHEKAEYFAAVLEGVLILVAAFLILRDAIAALQTPVALVKPWLGLAISSVATAINAAWGWFLIQRGADLRSPALVADGWHLWTDVVTSLAVVVGLVLAIVTGWTRLDALLAGAVALYIVWAGWRIIRTTMSSLMDEALTTEVQRRIHAVISEKGSGAIEAHDIRTRIAGRASYIEFHLVVPGEMSVARSHQICDRLEAALMEAVPGASVLIHVEPHLKAKGDLSGTNAVII
jgi:cation diffusion facilitator family transporter